MHGEEPSSFNQNTGRKFKRSFQDKSTQQTNPSCPFLSLCRVKDAGKQQILKDHQIAPGSGIRRAEERVIAMVVFCLEEGCELKVLFCEASFPLLCFFALVNVAGPKTNHWFYSEGEG